MKLPQTGGCLCGALRYEINEAPQLVYTCHCTDCHRLTGSAFSMGLVTTTEAFSLSGADPLAIQRTADSGRTSIRWFCPECGTWFCSGPDPHSKPSPGERCIVQAGTLDDTSRLRPTLHFWTRSAQPWIVLPEGDRRFETQPDGSGE